MNPLWIQTVSQEFAGRQR